MQARALARGWGGAERCAPACLWTWDLSTQDLSVLFFLGAIEGKRSGQSYDPKSVCNAQSIPRPKYGLCDCLHQ